MWKTKSCGCKHYKLSIDHPGWKGYSEISGKCFYKIKKNALSRGRFLDFEISIEYIWDLFLKQNRKCALSGVELQFQSKWDASDGTASLDRIDSSKGYTPDNVQWVDKDINYMKQEYNQDYFISCCKAVANYQKI